MKDDAVHQHSFEQLRALFRKGDLSPVAVAASALDHAEQIDKTVNAFALLDRDRAMAAAQASEIRWQKGRPLSAMDGMLVAVKEGAAVEGWPSRRGSLVTSQEPLTESAVFVSRLMAAGVILIGKTRSSEFAWKAVTDSPGYGITRNPLNPTLTPGGSSGGCAAAVASGVVRVSIGSDAAGSVRIPAAFTGTLGLKPTFGRIPVTPLPSAFNDIVHYGPIAACAADMIAVMKIVSGPSARDWTSFALPYTDVRAPTAPANITVGLLEPQRWNESVPVIQRGMNECIEMLTACGFQVRTVDFDVRHASLINDFYYRLGCLDAVESIPVEQRGRMDPGLLRFVRLAREVTPSDLREFKQQRDSLVTQLYAIFETVDALMLPTMPILPFEVGRDTPDDDSRRDWMSWNPYTPAFNLAQAPAISVPVWPLGSELPVGVQLVAPKCREDVLLGLASWFEAYFATRMPSLPLPLRRLRS